MDRSGPGWRLPLAIILVLVNIALVGANLNKHSLFPFDDDGGDGGAVSGDTTVPDDESVGADTTVDGQPIADDANVEAQPVTGDDDWPGGRGPVPEGPPEARRILIAPDGSALVTGSSPDWDTAMQVVDFVASNLGSDRAAIDNQLTWHPNAALDVQSGLVSIEQAATFQLGQAEIDPTSLPTLDFVAELLTSRQSLFVVVIGHTEDVGDEELNAELATLRADAVVSYLVERGVIPSQLVVAAAGDEVAGAVPDPGDVNRFNRRVELQFKNFLVAPGEIG